MADSGKPRPVYSTGPDGTIHTGGSSPRESEVSEAPARQRVRVRRDRSGRRGKTVTLVGPLRLTRDDADEMLRSFKKRCGAGGTLKRSAGDAAPYEIEVQGDHVEALLAELVFRGYPAKRAGG